MSKFYLLLSLLYFYGICWILSLFPKIIIFIIVQYKGLPQFCYWLITFGTALVLLNNFRRKWNQPLIVKDNEVPLLELYPSLKEEILQLVQKLDIKQDIRFYTNDFQGINGRATSNKSYANVTLSRGVLQLEIQDIKAILLHELFHVKHWIIHFINFEIASSIEEIISKIGTFHEKKKRNFIYRYFQIDYILQVFIELLTTFLMFLTIITNIFRMFFDEFMADKFTIDWNKSLKIVSVLKKVKYTNGRINSFSDDFIFNQHFDINIRCWLLDKYYYLKYIRPKWYITKFLIIITTLTILISYFYYTPYLLNEFQVFLDNEFDLLKKLWISLFKNNEELAKSVFVLILSGVGFVWFFISLIKIWFLGAPWKVRSRYFLYLTLLAFIMIIFINDFFPLPNGLILANAISVLLLGFTTYKE